MIPYEYLSFCGDCPPSGRWDQATVARMLAGEEWAPADCEPFVSGLFAHGMGRVIIFPAGHYAEHCGEPEARRALEDYIAGLDWCVIIATSDECATFRWDLFNLPDHARLWVQYPRPENRYPDGTRFIGCGAPTSARQNGEGALTRDLDMWFHGQLGNSRRDDMFHRVNVVDNRRKFITATDGFAQGVDREEYLFHLSRAWIALCPSGPCSVDTFRAWEAFEAGCIPFLDQYRPGSHEGSYWHMLGIGGVGVQIRNWSTLTTTMPDNVLMDRCGTAAMISAFYQQYKRRLTLQLHEDISNASGELSTGWNRGPDSRITVIIPTSPMPSNPDLSIIQACVASVRERLPHAEILITCDDIRPEQEDRRADYEFYLHRLAVWCNQQHNICPFIYLGHRHQSGMGQAILPHIRTPYVMYVEGDTTLEGDIDFEGVLSEMERADIAHMRFSHEAEVLPEHAYLFLERTPVDGNRFVRTIQFSNRPWVARTRWFQDMITSNFGANARTFIEDTMHGVWQHGVLPGPSGPDGMSTPSRQAYKAWEKHRGAVWADGPNIRHSGHLDGRAGDPKFPMVIAYDTGDVPPGAPQPGIL